MILRRLLLAALVVASTGQAQVQVQIAPSPATARVRQPINRAPELNALIAPNGMSDPPQSQHPMPPLNAPQAQTLRRAQGIRLAGLYEQARDSLLLLQKTLPHHPWLVTELARVHLARNDAAGAERLLKGERVFLRDSLLGGRELVMAYERLARPREALATALEVWGASSVEAEWAAPVLLRLAATEPRVARELLRAATVRAPKRIDLARAEALVLARAGSPVEAAKALRRIDTATPTRAPQRYLFGEEMVIAGVAADSTAAIEAWLDLASDPASQQELRTGSARRAFDVAMASGRGDDLAPRLVLALRDIPPSRWGGEMLVAVTRALREGGRVAQVRTLLDSEPSLVQSAPELCLESLLGDLREQSSPRTVASLDSLTLRWSPARFSLAEAQFFTGAVDSALANYGRVANDSHHPQAGAAFERLYLLEEAPSSPAMTVLGRIEWERWRGQAAKARALADSLHRSTPLSDPLGARAALALAELRLEGNDPGGALAPLLAIADSLPTDRLAPRARQLAGDSYLTLGDADKALAQYEECLARYPKAWNAPEVRRRVEQLRKARRS